MQRTLPRESKIRISFWRGITIPDLLVALLGLLFFALIVSGGGEIVVILGILFMCFYCTLFFNIYSERGYNLLCYSIKFWISNNIFTKNAKNEANIKTLTGIEKITDNIAYCKDGTAIGAIMLQPIEFRLLGEDKQNYYIDDLLAGALRTIPHGYEIGIFKKEMRLDLSKHISSELGRMEGLLARYKNNELTKNETIARYNASKSANSILETIDKAGLNQDAYFILVRGGANKLPAIIEETSQKLTNGGILAAICKPPSRIIDNYVRFDYKSTELGKNILNHFVITKFPLTVGNAWGKDIFDIPNTKVLLRMQPVPKDKAIKRIDTAIMELTGKRKNKTSKIVDAETHLETLEELLVEMQNENENLFDTTLIISALGTNATDEVKRALTENGFGFNRMFARQKEVFLSSDFSNKNTLKISTGLTASNISAMFPFISNELMDEDGLLLGENDMPVFFNAWKRNDIFVNSNMLILGKTGSGKSYATKTLLTQLSTANTKIFVLDPDGEYSQLAHSLAGKSLDVATNAYGIINPLQIMKTLGDDKEHSNDYHAHLQFLEEFFKTVLPGIDCDNLERLNNIVAELYQEFGINENVDVNQIGSDKFPTFDDLGRYMQTKLERDKKLETLNTYIAKFLTGGRYSNIWNGHTSLSAKEQFISFNFQSLFANKNSNIANGQMLLITKWLENEIINNRNLNYTKSTNKHIVIAIDEAHLFIDERRPVALDFMFQLAKRIRKYNGMLIVITQSVKDLIGTPEIARKSEAIISASQYSMIFNLPPNDMNDLCGLYSKSGGINEVEQYCITHNPRGVAFFISSPENRTNFKIIATPQTHEIITNKE